MPLLVNDPFEIEPDALTSNERDREASPLKPVLWHVEIQGRVVRFFRSGCKCPFDRHGKRGGIGPWTHQSRMNMLRFLNRVDWKRSPAYVFLTLTYPDEIDHRNYTKRSLDKQKFFRLMESHYGREVSVLWRWEWKKRKTGNRVGELMPHMHAVPFGVWWLDKEKLREMWASAIGRESGPLSTVVRRVYGVDGVAKYLAKYLSKEVDLDIGTYHNNGIKFGRHWGVTRSESVKLCPVALERVLTRAEVKRVRQFGAMRWSGYDADTGGGFTLLGETYVNGFGKWLKSSGQTK